MDMEKKIFELASGENRLNPDEQRYFLGTFGERVVLTATIADADDGRLQAAFERILEKMRKRHLPLSLKLSSKLKNGAEIHYLKLASDHHISATIVDEEGASSPFGFVLHTDHAENLEQTDIRQLFPDVFSEDDLPQVKKSIWKKLFGG